MFFNINHNSHLCILIIGGVFEVSRWNGTTDITRTIHLGKPSAHEKACYTAVLKGHIGLGNARFPNGTTGHALDVLARIPLWKDGLDFRHGTGHGVGSYLNVQEFDGNCSVQVYSVQASIPKDPAVLWNADFIQAEELFKQPSPVLVMQHNSISNATLCLNKRRFISNISAHKIWMVIIVLVMQHCVSTREDLSVISKCTQSLPPYI